MLKKITRMLLLFLILLPLSLTGAYMALPASPMGPQTASYEKHYRFTAAFPFLIKYYLLKPENYDPAQSYPLVLVLHGANRTTFAGSVLAASAMRQKYPAFVVVPIAPIKSYWASPGAETRMGGLFPAISHAVSIVDTVKEQYKVDPRRVYVVGHSMGGFGAFGAVALYPSIFAAAVPVCGGWDPAEARKMAGVPVMAFHGAQDDMIPASYTRNMAEAIRAAGGRVGYTELPGVGHRCDLEAFNYPPAWDWLFAQTK